MDNKKIIELLKPLRTKMFLQEVIEYLSYSLFVWSISSFILMTISKIITVTHIWDKILVLMIISLGICLVFSIYKRPTYRDVAIKIDSMGLEERLITSLELQNNNSDIAIIQRKDAIKKLQEDDYKKQISLKPPAKILIIALILVLATVFVSVIRTEAYYKARKIEQNEEKIEEEKEEIEKVIEKVKEDKKLSIVDKKDIEKKLEELKKTLDKPNASNELQKEIIKTKNEIEKIKEKMIDDTIKNVASKLSENEISEELAKAIEERDLDKISEIMQKMIDKANGEKNKEKLESISQEISDTLKDLENMDNINDVLNQMSATNSDKKNQENKNQQGQQGQGEGQGENQGEGQKQGEGEGQGAGQGTGQGEGEGTSGKNGSKEGSTKQIKEYEKIFAPKNLGGDGQTTQVHGEINNAGSEDIIQVKKFGDKAGETIPYSDVLNAYKKEAYQNLDRKEIPVNMKDIIKKYFSDIE